MNEEARAQAAVAEANARGFLLGWTLVRTACPACGQRNVVEVRQRVALEAKPAGTYSIAGVQDKVVATERPVWDYRCTRCGASGLAEPKDPGEN